MKNHYRKLFIVYYYYMLKQKWINNIIGEYYISGYFFTCKLILIFLFLICINTYNMYVYVFSTLFFLFIDSKFNSITKQEVLQEIKCIENIKLYRNIVIGYGVLFLVLLILAVAKVLYIMVAYKP